jgi:hypothetical protein
MFMSHNAGFKSSYINTIMHVAPPNQTNLNLYETESHETVPHNPIKIYNA